MSSQAEAALRILMRMYVELDQRTGWASEGVAIKAIVAKEEISEGRTRDALRLLKSLKMLETRPNGEDVEIKISAYGVEWMDKSCPLTSRHPEYEFSMPTFRSVKLVGPDEFYGRGKNPKAKQIESIDWTKWGAIAAIAAIPMAILLWWFA